MHLCNNLEYTRLQSIIQVIDGTVLPDLLPALRGDGRALGDRSSSAQPAAVTIPWLGVAAWLACASAALVLLGW
jgi:hypothetical protein